MIVTSKIEVDKLLYLSRNEELLTKKLKKIFDIINKSQEKLKFNKEVIDKFINYFENKVSKNIYTEREKFKILSIINKLITLKDFIIKNKIFFQIIFRNRFYFYPFFNLNSQIIQSLLDNGLIKNMDYWNYVDISAAEFRSILFLLKTSNKKTYNKYKKIIDDLLKNEDLYLILKDYFKLTYKRSYIKRIILINIHGGKINLNNEFSKFLEDIKVEFENNFFILWTQFLILHLLLPGLKYNQIPFFLNYDGGYIIKIKN